MDALALELSGRLATVRAALKAAARRAGRSEEQVRLVAVTKMVPPALVRLAYDLGVREFGESYVQEALDKVDRVPGDVRWHFIGHLQSNKARRAMEIFSMIQSLDRPSLADALERAARNSGHRADVLIQVNVAAEASKAGATFEGAVALAKRAPEWPNLRFLGLMAIPPYADDPEEVRPHFRALRQLAERIDSLDISDVAMRELSMGMSADFGVAVEEGATLVRIGTAIFGERLG